MSNRRREDRVPAADAAPDQERAIIAWCLTNPHDFYEVNDKLQPEHFSHVRHPRIWEAMLTCSSKGKTPNRKQIGLYIDKRDREEETALPVLLASMIHELQNSMEGFDFQAYVDTVRSLGDRRQIVAALEEAIVRTRAMDVATPIEDVIEESIRSISTATSRGQDRDMRTYADWGLSLARRIETAFAKGEEGGLGLSPGLKAVQEVMGPLLGGKLYVLAGMSSGGKSALARQIAEAAAKDAKEKKAGWVYQSSMEMHGEEYAARSLAEELGIPSFKLERADVNRAELDRISVAAYESLKEYPILVDQRRRMTLDTLRSRMMDVRIRYGLAMGVVDHLLLIRSARKAASLQERVSETVEELKIMAGEFNVPILLLAQVNEKNILERPSGWPIAADLFGGQAIQQTADMTLFVHRPEIVTRRREPAKTAEFKHREWEDKLVMERGKAFVFTDKGRGMEGGLKRELTFDGPTMTFRDI